MPNDAEAARWFAENLRPHEPMLRGWLRGHFRGAQDIDDLVQEAFVRVLQARQHTQIDSPKAFLFATARNLALMQLRRRHTECIDSLAEIDAAGIMDESPDIPGAVAHAQELELLTHAIQSLPTRCRQILTLRKIYGLSQKEVAEKLGLSEHTVEWQGTIALRKIGKFFARFERGQSGP